MKKLFLAVLLSVLVAGCVNQSQLPTAESEINVHDSVQVEVIQGDYIVDDMYLEMLDEQMNSNVEVNFSEMEDKLASDMGQFYYG